MTWRLHVERWGHRGPTLILIHGDRDKEAPLAGARALARATGWPLTVVAGIDYILPLARPEVCAAAIRELAVPVVASGRAP